ncbi:MAG: ATP-binding protein [Pseudomonadota bacterium]
MDAKEFFHQRHEQIVAAWFESLYNDRSIRYFREPPEDLRNRLNYAALAFRRVMLDNDWTDLKDFITSIAQKRFSQGFKVSEVQKAFELYRQTLIPLLFADIEAAELEPVMIKLQECMIFTITHFSEYFQGIHENFLRNHTEILEKKIETRTRELAESRQKYKTLIEDINEGFFVLSEGRVAFANRSFAHMHGYTLDQMLQTSYLDLVAEEHREMMREVYELNLSHGHVPARIEFLRLYKDGRKLPTEIMAKRTLFDNQVANIGICSDISERVDLEKRTLEAEKLKALAKQASSLAHEVRNPLSTVKMNLQLLSRAELAPEHYPLLQASLTEIDQIERRIQEMMDISLPLRLSYHPVDLRQLIEHCFKSLRQRLIRNQVKASLRLSRRIGKINVDPDRLEQALVNLLFNAVEAQPSGGRVVISARPYEENTGSWVEISISDQGPGVPREMLPYLFDPMFSQRAMGTGLGLHNVKKIMEAHGGSVRAKFNRLGGMTFYLSLPGGYL